MGEGSDEELLAKAAKASDEASRFANTAAEFAEQATMAAETAAKAKEAKREDALTKSIAHSAIVLTLTVVKAVRVVGYAALDAASHGLSISKRYPSSPGCAASAASAMSAGFEALSAASNCAQATQEAAAELQSAVEDGVTDSSERLAAAASKASTAA